MNLQLAMPSRGCAKSPKCPYCIADITDNKQFEELPVEEYKQALRKYLSKNDFNAAVLTGVNEPWQTPKYMLAAMSACKEVNLPIELSTSMPAYIQNEEFKDVLEDLDVLSISISTMEEFESLTYLLPYKVMYGLTIRIVFIMNAELFANYPKLTYLAMKLGADQITFKQLAGENDWIKENKIPDEHLRDIEMVFKGEPFNRIFSMFKPLPEHVYYISPKITVKFDYDCQDSPGRYRIFRCDGNEYFRWDATETVEEKFKKAFGHILPERITYDDISGWAIKVGKGFIKKGISTYKEALNILNYRNFK